jgi:hypothetical protein
MRRHKHYLGHFFSEEMAARAYDRATAALDIGFQRNFDELWGLDKILIEDNRLRIKSRGFRGVYYHPRRNRYEAAINVEGARKSLGYYTTMEQAAQAYDREAKVIRGDKARLNFPEESNAD